MTLLDRIKSLLGLGSTRSESNDRNVEVAVDDSPPDRSAEEGPTATDADDGPAAMETENPEDWGVPPGYDGDESDVQAGPGAFDEDRRAGAESGGSDAADRDADTTSTDASDTTGSDALDGGSVAVGIEDAEPDSSAASTGGPDSPGEDTDPLGSEERSEAPIEEAEPDAGDTDGAQTGPELTEIKGIGPAYEQRLIDAGVSSIDELVDAESASLAEATDLSETRVGRWQDRAAAMLE